MKERMSRGWLEQIGWLAFTTIPLLAFAFSPASATTLTPQNSGHCLSIVQDANELLDGARIEQRACNGASRQNWTLEDMGGGKFRAKVASSNKCLEPLVDPPINGTGLQQWTCNGSTKQLWTRTATLTVEGTYRLIHDSGRCIDVPGQSQAEGVLVNVWACWPDVRPHQSYALSQRVIAKHSGKCLDVNGGPQEKDDDAFIDQWTCNEGAWNQFWTARDAGNQQVRLVAQNSGKCLQPRNGTVDNSTPIVQMTCNSAATTQLWSLQGTATAGEYKLVHAASSKCIDIRQSLQTDGAEALLFTCKTVNEANQTFQIGTGAPAPPFIEQPTLSGEYWGLPTRYPAKSPYGGLHQIFGNAVRWSPSVDMVYLGGFWHDLNQHEDDYNRPRLEDGSSGLYGLDELAAAGKTGIIWTNAIGYFDGKAAQYFHAPEWVAEKCGNQMQEIRIPDTTPPIDPPEPWGQTLWNDCPKAELVKFIKTMFGQYRNDPALKYAYVTTFNSGEFFIPDNVYNYVSNPANFPNGAHLTPQKLESFAKAIIDAWVEAVGADKAVWTRSNDAWVLPISDTFLKAAPQRVTEYALLEKGLQLREGNAENIMANLDQPRIQQGVVPVPGLDDTSANGQRHWYLTARTIHDMLATPRTFYGDEFEIAEKAGAPFFRTLGDPGSFVAGNLPYYRLAVLNMLRKGQNWAVFPRDVRDGAFDTDSRFTDYIRLRDYFRQTAGYPVDESPDAWAMLQKTNDNCFQNRRHYHNYEKFLYQREVASGGMTTPVEQHDWDASANGFAACLPAKTHLARSTDGTHGNYFIYFDVDDAFATATEGRFRIAVTYKNTGTATWHLDYSTQTNDTVATPTVTNTNTAEMKTAIFSLSDASFRNAQAGGTMDFRINNGESSTKDVVIYSVRVLRGGQ
ncbi:MAG TPA: ricin-type beta-trefoil lectin domain protein [Steroidobacteraceae bacterium]|nr:ricin-type beta-trefoil lectin domain protein [Steroidobacteraceae bacterium]